MYTNKSSGLDWGHVGIFHLYPMSLGVFSLFASELLN